MRRTTLALMLATTSCIFSTREPVDDGDHTHESGNAEAFAAAHEGFTDAEEAVSSPVVGTTLPLLRISRPDRTAGDLAHRLTTVLHAMAIDVQQQSVSAWAVDAATATDPHDAEIGFGIVVEYDGDFDDLMVVNTPLVDMQVNGQEATEDELLSVARRVTAELVDAGVADRSITVEDADVSIIRSGYGGPDGEHDEWIDEILIDLAASVEGIDLADARLRIGVTPAGAVSSVQVTGVDVEQTGRVTIARSIDSLEDAFATYVAEATPNAETVYVSVRMPAYILYQDVTSSIVEPRYLIAYSVDVRDGDDVTASRTAITAWGMTDPTPAVEVWP